MFSRNFCCYYLVFQDFSKSSARYLYKNGLRLGSKSSPASPTKQEPQCTCLVNEKQNSRLRMSSANRGMLYVYNVLVVQGDKYGLLLSYFRYYYCGFLVIVTSELRSLFDYTFSE